MRGTYPRQRGRPAALAPTVPWARKTQLLRGTVFAVPEQNSGRDVSDDGTRGLSGDLWDHDLRYVRSDVRDSRSGESVGNAVRNWRRSIPGNL